MPILLDNVTCPYCGVALQASTRTTEHVIARRFVPKGALENSWNLILFACQDCNGRKAELEDEISAVSMQADATGKYASPDPRYAAEAKRKALGSRSRLTGARIAHSHVKKELQLPFMGGKMTVSMVAPPQVESQRVGNLAKMQMMAFFYFVTFDAVAKVGRFWRGDFHYFQEARRADWGRPDLRGFMATVSSWEPRYLAYGPDDFFNVVIRKHPTANCWSWGLEWNQSFRIMGFFGERAVVDAVCDQIPPMKMQYLHVNGSNFVRGRSEEPLLPEHDNLFYWETKSDETQVSEIINAQEQAILTDAAVVESGSAEIAGEIEAAPIRKT